MKKCIACIIVIFSCTLYGQINKSYFNVLGSFTVPLNDFSDDDDDFNDDGFSTVGFSAGVRYNLPLGHQSFALVGESQLLVNLINKEKLEDEFRIGNARLDDFEGGVYFNVPVMGGVKVSVPVRSPFSAYATARIGFNIFNQLDLRAEIFNTNYDVDFEFEHDITFAFGFETGIIINNKVVLGFGYLNLGQQDFDYEVSSDFDLIDGAEGEREFNVSMIKFIIGYEF